MKVKSFWDVVCLFIMGIGVSIMALMLYALVH